MEEVWKEIGKGRSCTYEISTEGNLRSIGFWGGTKLLKKHQNGQGNVLTVTAVASKN